MSASPSDTTQGARKRANGAPSHAGQYAPLSDGSTAAARNEPAAPAPLAGKIHIFVTLGLLLLTFSSLSAGRLREIFGGATPWSKVTPPSEGRHASSSLSSPPAAGTLHSGGGPAAEDGLPSLHRRVVAIADIHGSLSNLVNILSMSHLITQSSSATSDPSVVWSPSGADDVLVSTGDNVDRGDDTIAIYKLWENLRSQAGEERVRTCLGNHEVMNALGDWRYVTPGDIRSFGGEKARRYAMSSQGWVGRNWLDHYNLSYSIDLLDVGKVRNLQSSSSSSSSSSLREKGIPPLPSSYSPPRTNFVHGGHHPSFTSRYSLAELNVLSHSFLTKALDVAAQGVELRGYLPPGTTEEEMAMWGEQGPYWYRGYSYEKEGEACRIADEAMRGLGEGVGQIVMGHTPTFEHFVHRCPPRYASSTPTHHIPPLSAPPLINLIDTGISPAYSGVLSSLVFETWLGPEKKKKKGDAGSAVVLEEGEGEEKGEGEWEWVEKRTMRALYKEQGSPPGRGEWEDLVFEGRRVIV